MIFKLQRPLAPTKIDPPCLVYNEDRTIEFTAHLDESIFNNEFKIYVEADIEDKMLVIHTRVEGQDW